VRRRVSLARARIAGVRSANVRDRDCPVRVVRAGRILRAREKKRAYAARFSAIGLGTLQIVEDRGPGRLFLLEGVLRLGGLLATARVYPAPTPPGPPLTSGGEGGAGERVARWERRARGRATALAFADSARDRDIQIL
jgi:hypothetical protein